ncbi:DUF4874 domain-containing protein [Nocardioides sp. B-3]|uniref:DUF4874 domain-containing protein n=1 Tax=Nocardioides sp. B-3 TaxID=2895565 RepID=UPI0021535165|nr:DUF4874 domain-containing protein [Nocardioides sp. B-3]
MRRRRPGHGRAPHRPAGAGAPGASDVIATIQSGFVGLWGEGYYTDHYAADPSDPGNVTEANWEDRGAIVRALLDAAPRLTVQVRTMQMKQKIFGTSSGTGGALSEADAFSGSDISRVGHHNDCFSAAPDDWGTFLTDPISLDQGLPRAGHPVRTDGWGDVQRQPATLGVADRLGGDGRLSLQLPERRLPPERAGVVG